MKAVVMAGGEGSRLRPLTSHRPKPMVPICNRPIMEYILTLLRRHKVTEVVATVHYLADEIQSYFGDGSDFDVELTYVAEDTPLGTAGSVKKAEHLLLNDTFVIVSGDALTDCDLSAAISFHKSKKALATLVLARVKSPLDFGVVVTAEDGKVERFQEKPSWSEVISDTVNTGIYIVEPAILGYMEADVQCDWSADIFPKLLAENLPIYGFVTEGYWCDIGTIEQYREAHRALLSGLVDLPVPYEKTDNGVFMGPHCVVDPTVEITAPVCLGRNVKIRKNVKLGPYTVIGDNALVEEGSVLEQTIVGDSTYISASVLARGAIIGSRVTIKRDSVIHEDAVVGDRCLIDAGCTIRPRVKLWPDKIVERGSTVTMSLVWGNKWRGQLFRDIGVAGLSNVEITPDFACRLASAFGSCMPPHSRIVTARDSTRSSRMIKRAIIASLLSVGCDVLDMRSTATPVARHFIRASGAQGAVNVRKLPDNSRVTLIEMFDSRGTYLPRSAERKVESTFFREEFNRIDTEDLGIIEPANRAIEAYQADFHRLLTPTTQTRRLRVVCDYGYSALAGYLPSMLAKLGVESIGLNGFNDARMAPRNQADIERHIQNLREIVMSLDCDFGVLCIEDGERLIVVEKNGEVLSGHQLFGALLLLVATTTPDASVAMSVTAPTQLETLLVKKGISVIRTKADIRSLLTTGLEAGVTVGGDERGGFVFPDFHPGLDAAFALGKIVTLLQETGLNLQDLVDELPPFSLAYESVRCPWESKGSVMRRISEEPRNGARIDTLDGIKFVNDDHWVLILPDAVEPLFHVYAESPGVESSRALVGDFVKLIEQLQN